MKEKIANWSELKKMMILGLLVGIVLLLLSLIGLFLGQPGWTIGVAIGTAIELLNILLLYKGSEASLDTMKPTLFLLCYFGRMTFFILGALVTVMCQFFWHISAFTNSVWGLLIGYTPMQAVIIISMAVNKKNPITISTKEEK